MKATENRVVVVEKLFEVVRCDCYTSLALEVLRNEQRMMRRFRHDGTRETLRWDDGPLCPQALFEKGDSARSGDWSRSTLSVVIHFPSRFAHIRLPCREMNCGAFTKWKQVCEFRSCSVALPVLLNVWRYHRHALAGSGVSIDVTVNWSNARFVIQRRSASCSNSWWALSHQFPQATFPAK